MSEPPPPPPPHTHVLQHAASQGAARLFVASLYPARGGAAAGAGSDIPPCAACAACDAGTSFFVTPLLHRWMSWPWDLLCNTSIVHGRNNTYLVHPCPEPACPVAGVLQLPRGNPLGTALRQLHDRGVPRAAWGIRVGIAAPAGMVYAARNMVAAPAALDTLADGAATAVEAPLEMDPTTSNGLVRTMQMYASQSVRNALAGTPTLPPRNPQAVHVAADAYNLRKALTHAVRGMWWMAETTDSMPANMYAVNPEHILRRSSGLLTMREERIKRYPRCLSAPQRVSLGISVWLTPHKSVQAIALLHESVKREARRRWPRLLGGRLPTTNPSAASFDAVRAAARAVRSVGATARPHAMYAVWPCASPHAQRVLPMLQAWVAPPSGSTAPEAIVWALPSEWTQAVTCLARQHDIPVWSAERLWTHGAASGTLAGHVNLPPGVHLLPYKDMTPRNMALLKTVYTFDTLIMNTSLHTFLFNTMTVLDAAYTGGVQLVNDTGAPLSSSVDLQLFCSEMALSFTAPAHDTHIILGALYVAPPLRNGAVAVPRRTLHVPATLQSWMEAGHVPGATTYNPGDAVLQMEHYVMVHLERISDAWDEAFEAPESSATHLTHGPRLYDLESHMEVSVTGRCPAFAPRELQWAVCPAPFTALGLAAAHVQARAVLAHAEQRMHYALRALRELLRGARDPITAAPPPGPRELQPHWQLLDLPPRAWAPLGTARIRGGTVLTEGVHTVVQCAPRGDSVAVVSNALAFPREDDHALLSPPLPGPQMAYIPTPAGLVCGMIAAVAREYLAARTTMTRAHHTVKGTHAAARSVRQSAAPPPSSREPSTCFICMERAVDHIWPCQHGTCSVCSMQHVMQKKRGGLDTTLTVDEDRQRDSTTPNTPAPLHTLSVVPDACSAEQLRRRASQVCGATLCHGSGNMWLTTSDAHLVFLTEDAVDETTRHLSGEDCIRGDIQSDYTPETSRRTFTCPICRSHGGVPQAVAHTLLERRRRAVDDPVGAQLTRAVAQWCAARPSHVAIVFDPRNLTPHQHDAHIIYTSSGDIAWTVEMARKKEFSPAVFSAVRLSPDLLRLVTCPVTTVQYRDGPPE